MSESIEKDYTLYMDTREKEDTKEKFKTDNKGKRPIKIKKLIAGDFRFGSVGVERKTIDDFCSGMKGSILWSEMDKLVQIYKLPYLVIEWNYIKYDSMKNKIWGAIAKISSLRINVMIVEDTDNLFRWLFSMYDHFLEREDDEHWDKPKLKFRKYTGKLSGLSMLLCIPKVKYKKAIELLKEFGTVKDVLNANPKELKEVKGIGPKIVSNISNSYNATYDEIKVELKKRKAINKTKRAYFLRRRNIIEAKNSHRSS